jgi:hypothetical protein
MSIARADVLLLKALRQLARDAAEFKEENVKRDDSGKFAAQAGGGSGGGSSKTETKTEGKKEGHSVTLYRAGGSSHRYGGSNSPTFYSTSPEGTKPFEREDSPTQKHEVKLERTFDTSNIEDSRLYDQFLRETDHPARRGKNGNPYWTVEPDLAKWLKEKDIKFDSIKFDDPTGEPSIAVYESERQFKPKFKRAKPNEFIQARSASKRSAFLSLHTAEELKDDKLFLSEDGKVGIAVTPEGDIQNVFNNGGPKGAAAYALVQAIENGGRMLDCYDGFLPDFYRQFGFQETGRIKFKSEFAHKNWDSAKYDSPDGVFMVWKGWPPGGSEKSLQCAISRTECIKNERSTRYEPDWDTAKAASKAARIPD